MQQDATQPSASRLCPIHSSAAYRLRHTAQRPATVARIRTVQSLARSAGSSKSLRTPA